MEELLNKLIKRGWKPNGLEGNDIQDISYDKDRKEISVQYIKWCTPSKFDLVPLSLSLRQLTSKESGLWQFVCENGMIKHEIYEDLHSRTFTTADHSDFWYTSGDNYEYRIIESALCNEDELENFLLDNIKIS